MLTKTDTQTQKDEELSEPTRWSLAGLMLLIAVVARGIQATAHTAHMTAYRNAYDETAKTAKGSLKFGMTPEKGSGWRDRAVPPFAGDLSQPHASAPGPDALNDYAFLRERVMEEHGWSSERAEGAIVEYMRFLQMLAWAPKMELVASDDVDLVWHEHLLDTSNYASDSQRLFGRFLHHRRARTASEVAEIPASYTRTKETYKAQFNEEPPTQFWGSATKAASMCGGGDASLDLGADGRYGLDHNHTFGGENYFRQYDPDAASSSFDHRPLPVATAAVLLAAAGVVAAT